MKTAITHQGFFNPRKYIVLLVFAIIAVKYYN